MQTLYNPKDIATMAPDYDGSGRWGVVLYDIEGEALFVRSFDEQDVAADFLAALRASILSWVEPLVPPLEVGGEEVLRSMIALEDLAEDEDHGPGCDGPLNCTCARG